MSHANPLTLGSVVSSVTAGDFDILISSYQPFESHPFHVHDRPAFVYVLDGDVEVRTQHDSQHCLPESMRLIPAGDRHQTRYGANASRALVIGVSKQRSTDVRTHSAMLDHPAYHPPRAPATVYARRVVREIMQSDSATPLAIEGLMLELLASGTRNFRNTDKRMPAWLIRLRERIEAEFRLHLTLGSLALEAGVHPVHLSRTFRSHFNRSIAQYQRELRIEWAAAQIMSDEKPLGRIAVEAGFADHSEFTRRFVDAKGVTPSQFRAGR